MARIRFDHWLTRRVGYEALLLSVRRGVHRAAACAIEETDGALGGTRLSDEELTVHVLDAASKLSALASVAAACAEHWIEVGVTVRAALHLILAAQAADLHGRPAEALSLCGKAELCLAESTSGVPLQALALARATVLHHQSRLVEALELLDAVPGDGVAASGAAAVKAQTELLRGNILHRLGRYDESETAFKAASLLSDGDPHERLARQARLGLAMVAGSRGDYDKAIRMAAAVLEQGGDRDPIVASTASYSVGVALSVRGDGRLRGRARVL